MGLDGVELLMEVEEAFNITIPDDVAIKILTVGDLYKYVLDCLNSDAGTRPSVCLTAVTFNKLRRLLMSELGIDRGRIRPDSPTDSILPTQDRRVIWSRLEKTLKLKLPRLTLPQLLEKLCWIVPAISAVVVLICMLPAFSSSGSVLAAGVCFVTLYLALRGAMEVWATLPSPAFATLGGLAQVVMAENLATIRAQHAGPNPTDTWEVLQAIIVAQLGVNPADVTPQASFVYDLGLS
jgi:acyl carrier protein